MRSSGQSKKKSGKTHTEKTLFECLQEARQGSEIQVIGDLDSLHPARLMIRLRGPIAAVPCFKNNRRQGRWLKNHVLARLQVLGDLFELGCHGKKINYGTTPLFLYAAFATKGTKRGTNFDADNALTTVKDWLEPRIKNGRDRAWGIGIIDDDRYITAFGEQQPAEKNITEIVVCPLEKMDGALRQFRKQIKEH